MTRFATWLSAQRTANGWTRAEVAQFIRSDAAQVARWEAGESLPRLPLFARLCRLVNADANEVLRLVADTDTDAAAA